MDLKYSHQLTVIHKRGFYGYLCDNDSEKKMGRLNLMTKSESQPSK